MQILVKNLKGQPDLLEKLRQEMAQIELSNPYPEEDLEEV